MSKKQYDVVAVTGTYTDKNGVEKKRYLNCGVVIRTDKGFSLKMECYPVGGDGWFMLFEPRNNTEQKPAPASAPNPEFDDDLPF